MARGRGRDLWWHTATLQALILEKNRDPEKRRTPFTALEFHPFYRRGPERRRKTKAEVTADIRALAAASGARRGGSRE